MITVDVEQGTPEWFTARCGIPTASNFDKIVTSTGAPSKQAQKYMYQLAVERLTGKTEETYSNLQMERGKEMESEARALYELFHGVTVQQVGVCYPSGKVYICGASPDGLVGEDGLLEIKCPSATTVVSYLLDGKLPTEYVQQVQGQLFVTGRQWVDFMAYYPGIKPMIVRVHRDENFISCLKNELEKFSLELEKVIERIK